MGLCTTLEQCNALQDVYETALQYGDIVSVYIRNESDIVRDLYDDYKSGNIEPAVTHIDMPAFPIQFQPTQRQLEKAGIKEKCECLIYTPLRAWTLNSLEFDDIDMTRSTVDYQGKKYVIKEKAQASQFTSVFLYITLGLNLK